MIFHILFEKSKERDMLIRLKNIIKEYGSESNKVVALNNVSFDFSEGIMYAIMGKSGCGKSTLLNIIGGLTQMTSGELYFKDNIIKFDRKSLCNYRLQNIGIIVQNFALINDKSARANIELPLNNVAPKVKKAMVNEIATKLGIKNKLDRYPFELSGGECQRISIARALINNQQIILADEPTGSLDSENGENIMRILRQCVTDGKTVIIVTHDEDIAIKCDVIIHMHDGKIVER